MNFHTECLLFGIYFLTVSLAIEWPEEAMDFEMENPTSTWNRPDEAEHNSYLDTAVSNHIRNQHLQQYQYLPDTLNAFLENRRRLQVASQISKNQFRGDSLTKHLNVAHHHKNIQDATTEGTDSGQAHLMQASDESHRRRRLMKYFLADGVFRKSILSNDFGIVKKTQDDLAPHHKNIDYTDADRRQPHVMTVSDASQMRRRLMQKFLNDAELRKSILSDNTSNVDKHIEYTTPNKQPAPAKHEVHNSAQTLPSKVTKKSLPIVEPTTLRPTMASTITTFATQENVSPNTTKVVILKAIEVPIKTPNSSANLLSGLADILCSICQRKSMMDCLKRFCNDIRLI